MKYAVESNNLKLLSYLLSDVKIDPKLVSRKDNDKSGKTLMHLTAESGNTAAIYILGRELDTVDVTDNLGNTPLHVAVEKSNSTTVCYLLSLGSNVQA